MHFFKPETKKNLENPRQDDDLSKNASALRLALLETLNLYIQNYYYESYFQRCKQQAIAYRDQIRNYDVNDESLFKKVLHDLTQPYEVKPIAKDISLRERLLTCLCKHWGITPRDISRRQDSTINTNYVAMYSGASLPVKSYYEVLLELLAEKRAVELRPIPTSSVRP